MTRPYPLIVLSQAPYSGCAARAALDLALAFAVFNQAPQLLFEGAGVLQLVNDQLPESSGRKSLGRVIDSFPLYDIDQVCVSGRALQNFRIGAERLPTHARVLDEGALRDLRGGARHILSL